MEKKKPIKITWPSLIIVASLIFLITYSIIDATVTRPNFNKKVNYVNTEFDSLKIFLDIKLPELESAIELHEAQLERQNLQLQNLGELAKCLELEEK
jgi:hypothetical protein